ncbi:hypothetical protein ABIA39_004513 [Nocardia sp. GAS34]|uniref:hypothetical protein n=1 Tax=unclassified Nocardia TaxID=2637762 RepID=UPI003D23780B
MNDELASFTARRCVRAHGSGITSAPAPDAAVVVVGYRTAYDVVPSPGTVIVPFRGLDLDAVARSGSLAVALIAVEHATNITASAGFRELLPTPGPWRRTAASEFAWYLLPVAREPGDRYRITRGPWADSGHDAVLPRTLLTRHAPTAPSVVAIYDLGAPESAAGAAHDRPRSTGVGNVADWCRPQANRRTSPPS